MTFLYSTSLLFICLFDWRLTAHQHPQVITVFQAAREGKLAQMVEDSEQKTFHTCGNMNKQDGLTK